RGRRAEHRAMEVATRQTEIEWPLQARAVTAQVLEQLTIELLDLGAVLLQLDPGDPAEPGGLHIGAAVQIFDERHAVLRARNENMSQRRREHPVRHQTRFP